MIITKQEFQVIWSIDEGKNDIREIRQVAKLESERVKKIMEKLDKLGLIRLTRKDDYWFAYVTETANKKYISNKKYAKWIPRMPEVREE